MKVLSDLYTSINYKKKKKKDFKKYYEDKVQLSGELKIWILKFRQVHVLTKCLI